ncbi:MAG: CmpA/NrtA family ABC transporter substrate-binding protein [Pseudohongiella sp.]|nr:CmpA/NrtA family ABC transporter substrate-binding protein [Pseudohongiella sp.]
MATRKDSQFTPASEQSQVAVLKRRDFLKTAAGLAGVAALGSGLLPGMSSRAFGAGVALETRSAKLGFIALTDAAPLFVAVEKGFFAKHGMTDVSVEKQSSWGTTRDNLVLGSARNGIDGSHILTPMPYLMTVGAITTNNIPTPMYILGRLNVAGQGISVSNEYLDLKVGTDTTEFAKAIAAKRAGGKEIRAAVTFPGGTHDLWMRYWLAAGGINPDSDIATITVPPPQMVANMKVGSMDTFCVGAPWNAQLINQKIGYTAVTTGEIWHNHPEKAFAMRADYVDQNPNATKALLKAIQEAQIYCDQPENIAEVAEICARRRWINAPVGDLVERMRGHYDYGTGRIVSDSPHKMRFWDDHASYPFKSHDRWFLTENIRWGYLPASTDTAALVDKVNREELWRLAALELGVSETQIPSGTSRGIETFFDGTVFDPENPQAYLDSLAIKRLA